MIHQDIEKIQHDFYTRKHCSPSTLDAYHLLCTHSDYMVRLRPLTTTTLQNTEEIEWLAHWRDAVQWTFPAQFTITIDGTRRWLERAVLENIDRILFWIEVCAPHTSIWRTVGHAGLFLHGENSAICEIDNVLRGVPDIAPGIMAMAMQALLAWKFTQLGFQESYLRVFSDNMRAIDFYRRIGYREIQRVPLQKIEESQGIRWEEIVNSPYIEVTRYFITMKLSKTDWQSEEQ